MKAALRSLLSLILLAGFFELLLPEDQMRKYSRLVVGLLVLFSLVQLMFTAGKEFSADQVVKDLALSARTVSPSAVSRVLAEGERIIEAGGEKAADLRKKRAEEKINSLVSTITSDQKAESEVVIAEGRLVKVKIRLFTESIVPEESIRRLVGEFLEVKPDLVEVEMKSE